MATKIPASESAGHRESNMAAKIPAPESEGHRESNMTTKIPRTEAAGHQRTKEENMSQKQRMQLGTAVFK